jgi:thiol-disulfide isomerase/thioredoxin
MMRVLAALAALLLVAGIGWFVAPPTPQPRPGDGWLLVNFWSEWCAPCREEIPMLNALSRELDAQGIAIVGVNFDDDPRARTLEIGRRMGVEFPTLTASERAALHIPTPAVMPTTYIVSPDGRAVDQFVGLQTREAILAGLGYHGLIADAD